MRCLLDGSGSGSLKHAVPSGMDEDGWSLMRERERTRK